MKKVIITGVSGFIGQALASYLLTLGVEVWGVSVHPDKLGEVCSNAKFHFVQAEFQEYHHLPQIIPERGFDAFFHFAWQGYGQDRNNHLVQVPNISYACEAVYAAEIFGCKRFIFADSNQEFLKSKNKAGGIGFCSVYGAAKAAARRMCQVAAHDRQIEFIGVLFTNIFGVGDTSLRSTNSLIRKLLKGETPQLIKGDHLYDWTYIDDCVHGVTAAAQSGIAGRTYYVGSRHLRPFREIITEVRDIVAPEVKLVFGTYPDDSYTDYDAINTYALYRDTGFLPSCDFRESIQKTVQWVKKLQEEGIWK